MATFSWSCKSADLALSFLWESALVCVALLHPRQSTSALIIENKIDQRVASVQGFLLFSNSPAATTGRFRREMQALFRILVVFLIETFKSGCRQAVRSTVPKKGFALKFWLPFRSWFRLWFGFRFWFCFWFRLHFRFGIHFRFRFRACHEYLPRVLSCTVWMLRAST